MRIVEAVRRVDDGALMRGAFYLMLSFTAVFLVTDMRDLMTRNTDTPGFDPLHESEPVLPPALTDGKPAAPPVAPSTSPDILRQPIRFDLEPGGVLKAQGAIEPGAADRFRAEIEARGEYVKMVSLDSPGGSVDDAIAMSKLIRDRKLDTRVASHALCASSCPIVFSGGVHRIAEKDAVIGVHQVFSAGRDKPSADEAMSDAQATTARVTRHLQEMGIAPGLWLHALETPPDRLYYLTPREMTDLRLTTDAPPPTAKKKG